MTTFDDREKAYEKKFAHDEGLKFKAESRRNKMVAEWAGTKLGISGQQFDDYIKAVRKADLLDKGGDGVFKQVKADLAAKGVSVADVELRQKMSEFLGNAVAEIEREKS